MDRAMNHDQAAEMLGAHALDALERGEAALVEQHVAGCSICSAELSHHREVAALLAAQGGDASVAVWDRIAQAIAAQEPAVLEATDPEPAGPEPELTGAAKFAGGEPASLDGSAARQAAPRSKWITAVVALCAAAAIAAIATLGTEVAHLDHRVAKLTPTAGVHAGQKINLSATRAGSREHAVVVLTAAGTGYFEESTLPTLPAGRTYQLWEVRSGAAVSLGNLGRSPDRVAFAAGPTARGFQLAVTDEPAGGSPQPTSAPLIAGRV